MKLQTTDSDFNNLYIYNRYFLLRWKILKGYKPNKSFDFGQLLELAFALTNDLQHDEVAERLIFNNTLQYKEFTLGWDGIQPIDILFYEINQKLKRRINQYIIIKNKGLITN